VDVMPQKDAGFGFSWSGGAGTPAAGLASVDVSCIASRWNSQSTIRETQSLPRVLVIAVSYLSGPRHRTTFAESLAWHSNTHGIVTFAEGRAVSRLGPSIESSLC
jgi:hypothetical protein